MTGLWNASLRSGHENAVVFSTVAGTEPGDDDGGPSSGPATVVPSGIGSGPGLPPSGFPQPVSEYAPTSATAITATTKARARGCLMDHSLPGRCAGKARRKGHGRPRRDQDRDEESSDQ